MAGIPHARRRLTPRHTETRIDHLCWRDQRRDNSDEAFRLGLQLKCSIEDGRARLSDFSNFITKLSAKTENLESLQEANELPQHWSGGRTPQFRERSAIALLIFTQSFARPIVLNCSILCEYHLL